MKHLKIAILVVVFIACIASAVSPGKLSREEKVISQIESQFIATRESIQLRGAVSVLKFTVKYIDGSSETEKLRTTLYYDRDGYNTKSILQFIYEDEDRRLMPDMTEEFTLFKNKSGAIDSIVKTRILEEGSSMSKTRELFAYDESGLLKKVIKISKRKPDEEVNLTSKSQDSFVYQIFLPEYNKKELQHQDDRSFTYNAKGEIIKSSYVPVDNGMKSLTEFRYNSRGDVANNITSTSFIDRNGTETRKNINSATFVYHSYDTEGNWTKASVTEDGISSTTSITREIEYYK